MQVGAAIGRPRLPVSMKGSLSPHPSRLCRATFPAGEGFEMRIATPVLRHWFAMTCVVRHCTLNFNRPGGTPQLFTFHYSFFTKNKAGAVRKAPRPLALSQPPK